MDPLSVSASIIAVLQLSSEVVKYISAATGATKERRRLREAVRTCENILQQLKDEADDSEEGKAWSETIKALEAPDAPLGRLWVALRKVEAKLQPKKGISKALAALKWPLNEKEITEIFATIDREMSLLKLALTNDARTLIQEIKRTSKENMRQLVVLLDAIQTGSADNKGHFSELKDGLALLQDSQADLQDGLDALHRRHEHREVLEERQTILNWLTPIDYATQQNDFLNRRQTGTGTWLLDSAEFTGWVESRVQTLFCSGIPGAGKTILTSIVVDNLYTRFQNDPKVGIAYLYCNYRRQNEQKADDLLTSLLKQLASNWPFLPDTVISLYSSHRRKKTRPSLDEISRALQAVASLYSNVFIVVDALDDAVDGMFLLAQLHLESLIGKRSPKALRAAITNLPTGSDAYDRAYNDAMQRIEGQVRDQEELAKQALLWITCAKRPLTTVELLHALADNYGQTPLWRAATFGYKAIVKLLLEKGADIDSKDNCGQTPLSWVAERGREAVVKLLLENGADADLKDRSGRTPLWYAAQNGYEAIVKLLEPK
ncbi:hypothetical protein Sste5346_005283 [Sporothrix stenoceras]|uniref:Nephrocystin 3-like N-terminal domain-containing protein n=1 Tax=Sporothrix stenoceras TaxID=5173 RepID=A0ABR3Z571_9PEZI